MSLQSHLHDTTPRGASTGKWTAPDPCHVFSESDSKLYTKFEFCDEKNHRHLEKHINLQSYVNHDDQKNSKKSLHILEDSTSGVQVDDIAQVIV